MKFPLNGSKIIFKSINLQINENRRGIGSDTPTQLEKLKSRYMVALDLVDWRKTFKNRDDSCHRTLASQYLETRESLWHGQQEDLSEV